MDLSYWASSDIGQKRANNEDNFLIDGTMRLFVVADGMGGHADGATASAIATHTVREVVHRERDLLSSLEEEDPSASILLARLLEHCVHAANARIQQTAAADRSKKGMGTTLLIALVHEDHAYLAHVGDSRIYLRRGGVVYQLTDDHSILNELLRQGRVTEESFADSPFARFKNALARAVGPEPMVDVDTLDFELAPGDTLLMCSDGLHEYTDEGELAGLLAPPAGAKEISERLVDLANERGGKDNITALVVRVDGADALDETDAPLDVFRGTPLFAGLSDGQLMRLMNLAFPVSVPAGEDLCAAFEPADGMYLVLDGALDVLHEERHVLTLGPGDAMGALALSVDYAHPATVRARTDARVILVGRADFQIRAANDPGLSLALLGAILEHTAAAVHHKSAHLLDPGAHPLAALDPIEL